MSENRYARMSLGATKLGIRFGRLGKLWSDFRVPFGAKTLLCRFRDKARSAIFKLAKLKAIGIGTLSLELSARHATIMKATAAKGELGRFV